MHENQRKKLILRLASPGQKQDQIRLHRSMEARLQNLADEAGVPVAPVRFILDTVSSRPRNTPGQG